MPKIHPLPVLILIILSIILIAIASFFKKETPPAENFFLGAKNVIEEIVKSEKIDQKFFEEKTAHFPEKFAIYIKDLKSGETREYHSKDIFPTASIYKLAVMYSAYNQLEKGNLKKTDTLSAKQSALDLAMSPAQTDPSVTPPPSPPPDQDPDVAMSVEQALKLMITISDNNAAILLSQRLGWANMDKYMETEGFAEIDLVSEDSPYVTAETIGRLLEKIYKKETISQKASEEMIELLVNQKVNDRIPKYLPQGTKVAHKTGELDGIRNDAGIIYGKRGDYIFVFLSQTKDPLNSMETIANLSRDFYQELEK